MQSERNIIISESDLDVLKKKIKEDKIKERENFRKWLIEDKSRIMELKESLDQKPLESRIIISTEEIEIASKKAITIMAQKLLDSSLQKLYLQQEDEESKIVLQKNLEQTIEKNVRSFLLEEKEKKRIVLLKELEERVKAKNNELREDLDFVLKQENLEENVKNGCSIAPVPLVTSLSSTSSSSLLQSQQAPSFARISPKTHPSASSHRSKTAVSQPHARYSSTTLFATTPLLKDSMETSKEKDCCCVLS